MKFEWIDSVLVYITETEIYKRIQDYREKHKKELRQLSESKYVILIIASSIYLLLSLIPLKIIVTFVVLLFGMYKLSLKKLDTVRDNGLISYMPEGMKHAFLNRSVLDILCDMWFVPSLSLYLKAIITPIFDKSISPEEAYRTLDHLQPQQKKVFITKGLAFLCPRKVRRVLLPKGYVLKGIKDKKGNAQFLNDSTKSVQGDDDLHEEDNSLLDLMEELNFIVPPPVKVRKSSEDGIRIREPKTVEKKIEKKIIDPKFFEKKIEKNLDRKNEYNPEPKVETSLIKDNKYPPNTVSFEIKKSEINLPESPRKEEEIKVLFSEEDDSLFGKNIDLPLNPEMKKEKNSDSGVGRQLVPVSNKRKRSRVILSSEWLNALRDAPGRVDPKWDNYEAYKTRQQKLETREGTGKMSNTEQKLQVLKLILDLKNGKFLKNVDNKALASVGSVSLVMVVLQLIFSRK